MALRISAGLILLLALAIAVQAGKKKDAPESYAILAGTVFQQSGYALPNATVTLVPVPHAGAPAKVKTLQAISNDRGEFAFRVPAGSMRYTVRVAARGYRSQEKSVTSEGEERTEVTFQLEPESK